MNPNEFDKNFEKFTKYAKTGAIITLITTGLGTIASLGIAGVIIYLLLKNFG